MADEVTDSESFFPIPRRTALTEFHVSIELNLRVNYKEMIRSMNYI